MENYPLAELAKVDEGWKQLVAEASLVERLMKAFPGSTLESDTPDAE